MNDMRPGFATADAEPQAAQPGRLGLTGYRVEAFPRKAIICRPGDASGRVFLVRRGRVRVVHEAKSGARTLVSVLRRGDWFGDLFCPDLTSIDELALSDGDAVVWSIGGREFRAQALKTPELAFEVVRAVAEQSRALQRRVASLLFRNQPARLADTLLELAERHGVHCSHGGHVELRGLTQQDLADLVGGSRSSISTVLNELRRLGLLGQVGRVICLRDRAALEKLAMGGLRPCPA